MNIEPKKKKKLNYIGQEEVKTKFIVGLKIDLA